MPTPSPWTRWWCWRTPCSGVTTTQDVQLTAAGTLALAAAVNLGAGDLGLSSGSATTQTAAITVAGLQLTGAGPYTLTHTGNRVAALSARTDGTIQFTDADALRVGTVDVLGNT